MPYCTITSISESPLTAGVIWVGTDDGKVQLTQITAATWTDLTPALIAAAGAPADRWVSRVFASPHDAGDGVRLEERLPQRRLPRRTSIETTDFGKTWTAISGNLPQLAHQRRRAGSQEPRTC